MSVSSEIIIEMLASACDACLFIRLLRADLAGRGWWPRTVLPHVSSGPPQPSQAESMIWRARLRRWHTCKFSWRTLAPHGDPLPAMFLHRCGIIAEANCAVIFGGSSINNFLNDAWAVTLDAQEGQQEDSRVESAASGPSVHVHRLRVAGPSSHGRKPAQRSACSLVNVGPSLFLFGGSGRFGDFFDDLWRLDLTIPSTTQGAAAEQSMSAAPVEEVRYTKITGLEGPCGRWGHVGVGHLGKMWIFGGTCPGEAFNDLWCFDPSNHTWVEIRPGDALLEESAESCPSSTSAAAAAGEEEVDTEPTEENEVSQERYGATYAGSEEEEEEEFGSDGVDSEGSWTSESFDDLEEEEAAMAHMRRRRPAGRGGHAGCVVGRYFYVHGGNTVENSFKDCWRVDLTALNEAVDGAAAERSVPADGAPSSPREDSSSSSDGGGSAVGTSVATNYDAATRIDGAAVVLRVEDVRWEEVHENRAPPARIGHTMIAMGNRIIL